MERLPESDQHPPLHAPGTPGVTVPDPRTHIRRGVGGMPPLADVAEESIRRLLFRGDDREPAEIFRNGFEARDREGPMRYEPKDAHFPTPAAAVPHFRAVQAAADYAPATYQIRADLEGATRVHYRMLDVAGDMSKRSGVCVTARVSTATMFPLRESERDAAESDTFVYLCYVESGFNTHRLQVAEGLRAIDIELQQHRQLSAAGIALEQSADDVARKALWCVYAHELCTRRVPATHVLCAMPCRRRWHGADWEAGEDYAIDRRRIVWNRRFDLGDRGRTRRYRETAEVVLARDDFPWQGHSPTPEEGYQQAKPGAPT